VARRPGVLAGLPAVALVLAALGPDVEVKPQLADGGALEPGTQIATVRGYNHDLLKGERTALDFLHDRRRRPTLTRPHVRAVAGLAARILDTRKTTPGWRLLEKYAVRCGGGHNHRMGLYDGILIKDNHLAAMAGCSLREAVSLVRGSPFSTSLPVEIEVDTL